MVPLFLPITWRQLHALSWVPVHVNPHSGALITQQHFEAPEHCKETEKQELHPLLLF